MRYGYKIYIYLWLTVPLNTTGIFLEQKSGLHIDTTLPFASIICVHIRFSVLIPEWSSYLDVLSCINY